MVSTTDPPDCRAFLQLVGSVETPGTPAAAAGSVSPGPPTSTLGVLPILCLPIVQVAGSRTGTGFPIHQCSLFLIGGVGVEQVGKNGCAPCFCAR